MRRAWLGTRRGVVGNWLVSRLFVLGNQLICRSDTRKISLHYPIPMLKCCEVRPCAEIWYVPCPFLARSGARVTVISLDLPGLIWDNPDPHSG